MNILIFPPANLLFGQSVMRTHCKAGIKAPHYWEPIMETVAMGFHFPGKATFVGKARVSLLWCIHSPTIVQIYLALITFGAINHHLSQSWPNAWSHITSPDHVYNYWLIDAHTGDNKLCHHWFKFIIYVHLYRTTKVGLSKFKCLPQINCSWNYRLPVRTFWTQEGRAKLFVQRTNMWQYFDYLCFTSLFLLK